MPFRELIVLVPCHSLDDFPLYLEGAAADGLLAAWTALWHPALLHVVGRLPTWQRADDPASEVEKRLILIPGVSRPLLPAGWIERTQASGGVIVWAAQRREEFTASALALLPESGHVAGALADDFHALGYAYLMIELLARQMRYLTTIDLVQLQNQALAAAAAAMQNDEPAARDHLGRAFDALAEARDRFYPTTAWLIDLTLVAPTTLGAALRRELATARPHNLLITSGLVAEMARREPDSLAALRTELEAGRVTLIGGAGDETELPLLLAEAIARELAAGLEQYRAILGRRPDVFGRRRTGLTPVLPGLLYKFGFRGAVHFTLDGGRLPRAAQARGRWEGIDATAVDALFRVPLDAAQPETFLAYPRHMGSAMDHDYLATLVLAHWPGQGCTWLDDLRRVAAYGPLLGKFTLLADYLEAIDAYGHLSRHEADEYRTSYLAEDLAAGRADPLSRHVRRDRATRLALALESAAVLTELARGAVSSASAAARARAADWWTSALADRDELEARMGQCSADLAALAGELAAAIDPAATREGSALLVFNSTAQPQAASAEGDSPVEVPPFGFGILPGRAAAGRPIARELRLGNERLEVNIHPETGGIGAVRRAGRRGNRLSQQIALRCPRWVHAGDSEGDSQEPYSRMIAEAIDVARAGPDYGEIVSRGRLVDPQGAQVGRFQQATRLARGSDVVEIRVALEALAPFEGGPWESYACSRFAWADAACDLRRSVGGSSQASELVRLEAPQFIELVGEDESTVILTGGLPYHRRDGLRRLDSLLVVEGETAREFELAVGLDLASPLAAALALGLPPVAVGCGAAPRPPAWLFQLDQAGVVPTGWFPLAEEDRVLGFRVHLQESLGEPGTLRLRCFRPVSQARLIDGLGATLLDLRVEGGDTIVVEHAAGEWFLVEARWA
jgi:alpha-mannosidase